MGLLLVVASLMVKLNQNPFLIFTSCFFLSGKINERPWDAIYSTDKGWIATWMVSCPVTGIGTGGYGGYGGLILGGAG
jgi:hypothetical protein